MEVTKFCSFFFLLLAKLAKLISLKVSAPANSAHFRWYTDIQCKSIIYMLDNNIVLWSIRNKSSEKIVRLHHSKGVCPALSWDQALLSYSWVNRFQAGKVNRKDSHLVQYLCTYRLWQCPVWQSCLICRSCTGLYPGPTSFLKIYMNNLPNVLELELRPQSGRNKINLLLTPKRHILQ